MEGAEEIVNRTVIETPNTKRLVRLLGRHISKPIQIKNIAEFANIPGLTHIANYLGAAKEYSNRIEVHLNFSVPDSVREAIFIHEGLHILMRYEGFPGIATRIDSASRLPPSLTPHLEKLRDFFSSTIDHLKIYKGMQTEFDLDLILYFQEQVEAKISRFGKFSYKNSSKDANYYFQIQQDILDGLNYYEFPELSSQNILTVFRETNPDGFASCSALHGKLGKTGCSTPEKMFKCANLIKEQIIKYGQKKNVGVFNLLWQAIHVVKNAREIPLED